MNGFLMFICAFSCVFSVLGKNVPVTGMETIHPVNEQEWTELKINAMDAWVTDDVMVYGQPTVHSSVVNEFSVNKKIKLIAKITNGPDNDIWYRIDDDFAAYVSADYISLKKVSENVLNLMKSGTFIPESTNSFVNVNLTKQTVTFVKNGKLIVKDRVITGKDSTPTYPGTYHMRYKQKNVWFKSGVYVYYWMPFDLVHGGIGLHDSDTWRSDSEFETETGYNHANGSHGCVNMRKETARLIYENIDETIPINVFYEADGYEEFYEDFSKPVINGINDHFSPGLRIERKLR